MLATVDPRIDSTESVSFRAIWLLRIAFACRGIGFGIKYLWHPYETDSELFETMIFDCRWPEPWAQWLDDTGMLLYVISGLSVLLINAAACRSADQYLAARRWRRLEWPLLVFAAAWELALAAAATYRGGMALSQWTFAARAMRIAVPIVLAGASRDGSLSRRHVQGLAWATAATFLTHGLEALLRMPAFTTMILGTVERLGGWQLPQSWAESLLPLIGVADGLLAALLLTTRWRWVPWYMAGWGLITAVARATASDGHDFAETLLRLPHFAVPVVLAMARDAASARTDPHPP